MTTEPVVSQEDLIARAKAAISLGRACGVASDRPTNIYQVATELLAALTEARAREEGLREAVNTLRMYAQHSIGCAIYNQRSWCDCDCGLDKATTTLKEYINDGR